VTLALCEQTDAKGNLVQDAFLAAHAMEHGCVWITTDRDFSRFPALIWRLLGRVRWSRLAFGVRRSASPEQFEVPWKEIEKRLLTPP
jgi:PIN domain